MIRMLIAAAASGSGKTVVACALLRLLQRRGLAPCAFKCGPDYIDPMFHRSVLGAESRSLDLFLSGAEGVRRSFERSCRGHGAAVVEGVMGYYDGLGGTTDEASSWQVADTLALPALLVLRARGASLTLSAQIKGMCAFRPRSRIAGVLLNGCSPALFRRLSPVLEREGGVPVLGCLPEMSAARFDSRHLGLYTAAEIGNLNARIDALADALEENTDMDRLLALCEDGRAAERPAPPVAAKPRAAVAVARDEAFCFIYAETLEALREQGAELVFFSPLRDAALPEGVGGVYLPGGYPELYARQLSENEGMRESVRRAVERGLPTVAECGGFLYLGQSLCAPDGTPFPMCGALPGEAKNAGRAVRFGYVRVCAERDSLLFRAGERLPAHEFHYWDSTSPGDGLLCEKPVGERSWRCGFVSGEMYAAFPHLCFGAYPPLAERFVSRAERFAARRRAENAGE